MFTIACMYVRLNRLIGVNSLIAIAISEKHECVIKGNLCR